MSFKTRKFVQCDICKAIREVNDVAAPTLPNRWQDESDYYGNTIHCCHASECRSKFVDLCEDLVGRKAAMK